MGRRPKAALVLSRAKDASIAKADDLDGGLDTPAAQTLTARFVEVRAAWFRDTVDAVVQMGEILREGRERLSGSYGRWVEERLHLDRSTAQNYVRLAEYARHAPGEFERHKQLGISKLYKIARLPVEARRAVLATPELSRLTDGEFHSLTASSLPPARKPSGNMKAHGLRMRVQAATAVVRRAPPSHIGNPEMRAGLKKDLIELARAARALAGKIK